MNAYQADLHIHTVASPCGQVEMIPPLIVEAARMAGLDIIAIADHNCCENAEAVLKAAEGSALRVLPGLEVQSVEGVHLLCLFDVMEPALAMQELVYSSLPDVPKAAKFAREQFVVDAEGEFVRFCEKPISLPVRMDIEQVFRQVERLGGICVPSHIDRPGTGICGVLGMMPDEPRFEAVEISANLTLESARARYPSIGGLPIIQNSDAHWLEAVGEKRTVFHLEHRSLAEIIKALRGEDGRRIENA